MPARNVVVTVKFLFKDTPKPHGCCAEKGYDVEAALKEVAATQQLAKAMTCISYTSDSRRTRVYCGYRITDVGSPHPISFGKARLEVEATICFRATPEQCKLTKK